MSARAQQYIALKPTSARLFAENLTAYGVSDVWRQMLREGFPVARKTVTRLMRWMSLAGVIWGKLPPQRIRCLAARHVTRDGRRGRPEVYPAFIEWYEKSAPALEATKGPSVRAATVTEAIPR